MSESESPLFVYAIQKVDKNFTTLIDNKEVPLAIVIASMRSQLRIFEKEFTDKYKSGTI